MYSTSSNFARLKEAGWKCNSCRMSNSVTSSRTIHHSHLLFRTITSIYYPTRTLKFIPLPILRLDIRLASTSTTAEEPSKAGVHHDIPEPHSHHLNHQSGRPHVPTNPFPYPKHSRPTPHQIFHLPLDASQNEIKHRYYDLVRVHHPDSHYCRLLPATERHLRFQSISRAYEVLRGRTVAWDNNEHCSQELARRRRAYYATQARRTARSQHGNEDTVHVGPDDRAKDRILLFLGVMALAVGLYPGLFLLPSHMEKTHRAAAHNLTQARNDARELGEVRRLEVRRRARELREEREGQ